MTWAIKVWLTCLILTFSVAVLASLYGFATHNSRLERVGDALLGPVAVGLALTAVGFALAILWQA
jgi:hypothetical protein